MTTGSLFSMLLSKKHQFMLGSIPKYRISLKKHPNGILWRVKSVSKVTAKILTAVNKDGKKEYP